MIGWRANHKVAMQMSAANMRAREYVVGVRQ